MVCIINLQCLAFSNHSQTVAECGQSYTTPKACSEKEQLNRCSLNVIAVPGQCYGHTFLIGGKQYNTQGAMLAFLGDTPAANKAGGFKEGVSLAARKCRHCMATDS